MQLICWQVGMVVAGILGLLVDARFGWALLFIFGLLGLLVH